MREEAKRYYRVRPKLMQVSQPKLMQVSPHDTIVTQLETEFGQQRKTNSLFHVLVLVVATKVK